MRKKMLKAAGVLILSLALSMGMAGCAGKGDGEPGTGDTQDITLRDSDETGSNREPDKIETDVNIFGTCQDETHWTADKVVITRWR